MTDCWWSVPVTGYHAASRPIRKLQLMLNRRTLLSALMTLALGVWATGTALMQQDPELAITVDDGFTIAMVGDLIYAHDLGYMMTDPSFAAVVELLREADVATGNLEGIIVDGRTFTRVQDGRARRGAGRRRQPEGHGLRPGRASEQPRQRLRARRDGRDERASGPCGGAIRRSRQHLRSGPRRALRHGEQGPGQDGGDHVHRHRAGPAGARRMARRRRLQQPGRDALLHDARRLVGGGAHDPRPLPQRHRLLRPRPPTPATTSRCWASTSGRPRPA